MATLPPSFDILKSQLLGRNGSDDPEQNAKLDALLKSMGITPSEEPTQIAPETPAKEGGTVIDSRTDQPGQTEVSAPRYVPEQVPPEQTGYSQPAYQAPVEPAPVAQNTQEPIPGPSLAGPGGGAQGAIPPPPNNQKIVTPAQQKQQVPDPITQQQQPAAVPFKPHSVGSFVPKPDAKVGRNDSAYDDYALKHPELKGSQGVLVTQVGKGGKLESYYWMTKAPPTEAEKAAQAKALNDMIGGDGVPQSQPSTSGSTGPTGGSTAPVSGGGQAVGETTDTTPPSKAPTSEAVHGVQNNAIVPQDPSVINRQSQQTAPGVEPKKFALPPRNPPAPAPAPNNPAGTPRSALPPDFNMLRQATPETGMKIHDPSLSAGLGDVTWERDAMNVPFAKVELSDGQKYSVRKAKGTDNSFEVFNQRTGKWGKLLDTDPIVATLRTAGIASEGAPLHPPTTVQVNGDPYQVMGVDNDEWANLTPSAAAPDEAKLSLDKYGNPYLYRKTGFMEPVTDWSKDLGDQSGREFKRYFINNYEEQKQQYSSMTTEDGKAQNVSYDQAVDILANGMRSNADKNSAVYSGEANRNIQGGGDTSTAEAARKLTEASIAGDNQDVKDTIDSGAALPNIKLPVIPPDVDIVNPAKQALIVSQIIAATPDAINGKPITPKRKTEIAMTLLQQMIKDARNRANEKTKMSAKAGSSVETNTSVAAKNTTSGTERFQSPLSVSKQAAEFANPYITNQRQRFGFPEPRYDESDQAEDFKKVLTMWGEDYPYFVTAGQLTGTDIQKYNPIQWLTKLRELQAKSNNPQEIQDYINDFYRKVGGPNLFGTAPVANIGPLRKDVGTPELKGQEIQVQKMQDNSVTKDEKVVTSADVHTGGGGEKDKDAMYESPLNPTEHNKKVKYVELVNDFENNEALADRSARNAHIEQIRAAKETDWKTVQNNDVKIRQAIKALPDGKDSTDKSGESDYNTKAGLLNNVVLGILQQAGKNLSAKGKIDSNWQDNFRQLLGNDAFDKIFAGVNGDDAKAFSTIAKFSNLNTARKAAWDATIGLTGSSSGNHGMVGQLYSGIHADIPWVPGDLMDNWGHAPYKELGNFIDAHKLPVTSSTQPSVRVAQKMLLLHKMAGH